MPTIALATAIPALALDDDMPPLIDACAAAGIDAMAVAWDDPTVSWQRFDAVLLRSTWNYMDRLDAFLHWCDRVARVTRLLNPPDVVRWNIDKRYLVTLADAGEPVIDTHVVDSAAAFDALPLLDEFVVKPSVGAGSRGARRFVARQRRDARAHALDLLAQGGAVLVQPYLRKVDADGETALLFFNGVYSHAIRKGPLLPEPGAASTDALFAAERITARQPSAAERALAEHVLTALPFTTPLYARVDLLPGSDGPRLLELELIEPSVFLKHDTAAATRLVEALQRVLPH